MRTESPPSVAPTVKRILSRLAVAKRSVWARGPVVRWVAVLGIVAAIGGFGYWAAIPSPGKNLGEGRQYSTDAITRITHALDAAHIEYRVEDRRIGVATTRYEEATDVLSKLDINARSISEIRKDLQTPRIWELPKDKEQRELRARAEMLEVYIGELDGIVSASVDIFQTTTKTGGRPSTMTTAFVMLETKDSRKIDPKTVQSIKTYMLCSEPLLKEDAVSIMDREGNRYLDPSKPSLDVISRAQAREEEIKQEILGQLDWINDARVTVQMVAPPAPEPVAVVEPPTPVAEPSIGVNQPLDTEVASAPPAVAAPSVGSKAPIETNFAKIWVKIPRSFYYRKALPHRNLSQEDFQAIQARTETFIKKAAGYVIPSGAFEISIDTIPDDEVVIRDPLVAPAVPETRRIPSWWIPAGVGGGVAGLLLIVGLRLLATRRPRRALAAEPARIRFTVNATSETTPGASERVRELIRHNPEAAASVLNRWIGQGGHAA
ncbi:flagellar biosynthesis/type III secretory pathway lipoprotein [Singulisphaera acidiphila]|uniref:Flagellar biosynthesis/type III secretory pathway lipoprotein n=1 Tax=Singulisphaera acidiphila (strain ATCC BAA-1392 / DSM 18658 / VKM B-2454 / MOB10) TaxID=886293 RepID=L0DR14_SINAD|nr:flagellar biosynthesis/type III secretory pathway lipoprotein [Singulisphaera acidiphila]AGA31458.1 flagellar biosynthesis/type III secretory pathway lipoprotein [Singulisphaera acidiphila DSM 18658]